MAFTPIDLGARCKALYTAKDAASITFSGSAVTQWKDQTANAYHLVKTSGNASRPAFDANAFGTGEPGILFDGDSSSFGVGGLLSVDGIVTNTDKLWCFFRIMFEATGAGGTNARVFCLQLSSAPFLDTGTGACAVGYYGNPPFDGIRLARDATAVTDSANDGTVVALGTSGIYGAVFNGTNGQVYVRDASSNLAGIGSSSGNFGNPNNRLTLASRGSANVNNGAIMRVMALALGTGDLTQAEITQIVGWLDNPVMGAVGPTAINVTGAQTLASLGHSATAKTIGSVTGAQTTQATTQSATATSPPPRAVTGAQTTLATTQVFSASLGAPARVVSGNQTTSATTQSATVTSRVAITGAQTLSAPTQSATASVRSTVTGAQATPATTQSATASVSAAPTTSQVFVNDAGVWKPALPWVNDAGTWKRPAHIYVNDAGVWKEVGSVAVVGPIMDGLVIWQDASQLALADGAYVDTWPSLVGALVGTNFNVAPYRPTFRTNIRNGLPVVRFVPGSGLRWPDHGCDLNWTVIYVAHMSAGTMGRIVSGAYPPCNIAFGWHGNFEDKFYVEGWLSPDVSHAQTTDWKLYTGTGEGVPGNATATAYGNGVYLTGGQPGNANGGGWKGSFQLNGYSPTSGEETPDCEVAEVLFYNRKLPDAERNQVEDYLRTKWGPF